MDREASWGDVMDRDASWSDVIPVHAVVINDWIELTPDRERWKSPSPRDLYKGRTGAWSEHKKISPRVRGEG